VPTVYDLTREQLTNRLVAWGEPAFRAKQVWSQLWRRAATYDQMSDIPPALREQLAANLPLGVEVLDERTADRGSTRKALLRLGGEHAIETVLMGYRDRVTVCVSSQSGCAMGCTFCATGQMGLKNNLTAGEIAAQAVWARREAARLPASTPQRLSNVVFMGMGEPMGGCLLPRSMNTSSGPLTMTSVMSANGPSQGGKFLGPR
jgi:23S rRNA (adenine2503-C2)-methyltransferase